MSTEVYDTYDSMNLKHNLLLGLTDSGFCTPHGIQKKGIVPFCNGLDVLEQAEPDINRTVTFCVGILQQLNYDLLQCQALVLAPTLETVEEIVTVLRRLGRFLGLKVYDRAKGSQEDQNIGHVVVGTPISVLILLETKLLCLEHIKLFVLDEADVMSIYSCMNYEISKIFKLLPNKVQVGFFLEKNTPEVGEIARNLMTNPLKVVEEMYRLALEEIQHCFIPCEDEDDEDKIETLLLIIPSLELTHTVIFVNTVNSLQLLAKKMSQAGHKVFTYKGLESELVQFCSGASGVLLSTEIPSYRFVGSNVPTVVINYDTPRSSKNYIRREFGNVKKVISFLTTYDWSVMLVSRRLYKFGLFMLDIASLQFETSVVSEEPRLETMDVDSGMTPWLSYDEVYERFSDMNLNRELLFRISSYGFEKPTEVQKRGIVALYKKLNVFVQGESGPDQISTFCCAILQSCNENLQKYQSIVLTTCFDRVNEITRILRGLDEHSVKVYVCGESEIDSIDLDETLFHVVVGTPLCVLNMLKNKHIVPTHISLVVLDQADLTSEFSFTRDQIFSISEYLPSGVQVGVFSETMSASALEATRLLCREKDPVKIVVPKKNEELSTSVEGMIHFVIIEKLNHKRQLLDLFLSKLDSSTQCIIFVDTTNSADRLCFLIKKNLKLRAWTIRPEMDQSCREMGMREFRTGSVNVIITTPRLASYGLRDIKASLIINHDTATDMESYMERIARFGKKGGLVITHVNVETWENVVSLYDESVSLYDESGVYFEELLPTSFDHALQMISSG